MSEAVEAAAPVENASAEPTENAQESQAPAEASSQTKGETTTKAEAKAIAKKALADGDMDSVVKVKIDGQEHELTVRELMKVNSLEKASQKRMQEAATAQKQIKAFIEMARKDPKVFFKETGIDPYEFAEKTLAEQYELMQLSPEQRRLMEAEEQLKQYKEREEEAKKEEQSKEMSAREAKEAQAIEAEILDGWQSAGLPKHRHFGAWMAAEMLSHQKRTGEALQARDAAVKVKADFTSAVREIVAQMDPEGIQELLGKEVLKKVRDFEIKRVTAKASEKFQSPQNKGPAQAASKQSKKHLSESEYKEYMRKLSSQLSD